MVKHIILWKLKDELSAEEKVKVKAGIKAGLDFNIANFTHLQAGIIISYIGYGLSAGLTF